MEIVLAAELMAILQTCVDTLDSYDDPDDPQSVSRVCLSFRQEIEKNPDFVSAAPSYLSLALYGAVRFKNPSKCIADICDDTLPAWSEIQIKKPCVALVNKIREIDDDLAKQAVIVAFCLNRLDQVSGNDSVILRTIKTVEQDKGGDENEWI
jgi:hypothetical protein